MNSEILNVKLEHLTPIWQRFNNTEPRSLYEFPDLTFEYVCSHIPVDVNAVAKEAYDQKQTDNDPGNVSDSIDKNKTSEKEIPVQEQAKLEGQVKETEDLAKSRVENSREDYTLKEKEVPPMSLALFFSGFQTEKQTEDFSHSFSPEYEEKSQEKEDSVNLNEEKPVEQKISEQNNSESKVQAQTPLKEIVPNEKEKLNLDSSVSDNTDNNTFDKVLDKHEQQTVKVENPGIDILLKHNWSVSIRDVINDCILPFKEHFLQQNAVELVYKLLLLLEEHGDCPSVVMKHDSEGINLNPGVIDNLAKVSLKEHTIHVVRFVIDELKKAFQEPNIHAPRMVVTALAHDIGKIPAYHTGDYNTLDHPLIGELKFASLCEGVNISWVDQVRKSIREHHTSTSDQFTILLKNADRRARGLEMIKYLQDFRIAEFDSWFDLKEFVTEMADYINVVQTNKWVAVSINGVVYARPSFLYYLADELRKEKKIFDSLFIYQDGKETVIKKIVSLMKKEKMIVGLNLNQYCQKYKLTMRHSYKPYYAYLVPIRLESISMLSGVSVKTIEDRKRPTFLALYKIQPANTRDVNPKDVFSS